jgi:hypothetical protein
VRTVLRGRQLAAANVFGVREGDKIPPLNGWLDAEYALNLACRTFGATGEWSKNDDGFLLASPSWVGMVAELLGPETPGDPSPCDTVPMSEPRHLGPFRLAYLEALAAAADVRASRGAGDAQ